ncbi:MAG: LacI family transcriptional regulator [Planctomycetes bacterium]|nr:LacI family transcriptional regulator [Planctomycetota bacterium]
MAMVAGVSPATVSNALNGRVPVREEVRRRIDAAVRQLRYVPSQAGRMLRTNTSRTIGLIVPDLADAVFLEMVRGVESTAKLFDYSVFLCPGERCGPKEQEYLAILAEKHADGIVLLWPRLAAAELTAVAAERPLVIVTSTAGSFESCGVVAIDQYGGSLAALRYLYDLGHRRIALLGGPDRCPETGPSQDAFTAFCCERGLPLAPDYLGRGKYSYHSGHEAMSRLLKLTNPPTAILAANDRSAVGAIRAAAESGLTVPQDVSVVGLGDSALAQYCQPRLTTVAMPQFDAGQKAAKILLRLIRGGAPGDHRLTLPTSLTIRESAGPPRREG